MVRNRRGVSRRQFLRYAAGGATAVAAGAFGMGSASAQGSGRVVILGFDGVEPRILEEMMEQGAAPNLAQLRADGVYRRLTSTIPPQSPVAWSSFATCKNPGGHNIYDFVRRDPRPESPAYAGPVPLVGTGSVSGIELDADGRVASPPSAETYRTGETFWSVADGQGLRCTVLNVPFAFPPDRLQHGRQLSGLGVPDLRGTTSTYFSLSDSFASGGDDRLSGGMRIPLAFDGQDVCKVEIPGPRDGRFRYNSPMAYATAPIVVRVDRKSGVGAAEFDGKRVELRAGAWSDWLALRFDMSETFAAHGIARFYPLEIGQAVRLYMSCVQYDPAEPFIPYATPGTYTADLRERYGPHKTIGWAYDTHAMRQGDLDEEAFLADVRATMAWRARLTLDELERDDADVLISVWTATDRVGHMFWRFRDPKHPMYDEAGVERYGKAVEEVYGIADEIVGEVRNQLRPEDVLIVLSDHGFETFRTGFNVNAWLVENGYLKVANPALAERGLLLGVDWAETQAYCVGLSSVYLNLAGREKGGSVDPAQAEALAAELRDKLLDVRDPATGASVFAELYTRAVYSGEAVEEAPDLSLGFTEGYQCSKDCARGAVTTGLFEPNEDKWSGEHAAADVARLPGVLFANRMIEKEAPDIRDLGVTVLRRFERDAPGDFEGVDLL